MFRGTVEKVNAAGGTVDVKNDNIPGWMAPMSMTYRVDAPAVLKTLKGGDRITATVYEGDTSKLYQVRVAASPKKQAQTALPPISYVCPSPGEESFVDDKPGTCPKSGAELQAVRLDIAYKCLKTSYIREKPGTCPMDRTDLVPVTASIFWLCKNDPDPEKHYLEPGTCGDGSRREKAFEVRPHGDHNPRHGGPSVFMSEDLYHHVEATLVAPTRTQPAIFRVVLLRRIHAADKRDRRVGAGRRRGQERQSNRQRRSPLVLSRIKDGNAMEVRLPNAAVPSESAPVFFALRVKFKPSDKDWVTDHTFTSYSKEPVSTVRRRLPAVVTTASAAQHRHRLRRRIGGRVRPQRPGPAARHETGSARRAAEEHGFGHEAVAGRQSRRPLVSGAPRQGRRAETAAGSRQRHLGRQAAGADERRAAG